MSENSYLCNFCFDSNYLLLLPCGLCIICRSCYEKIVPDFNKKSNYKICEFCERPHNYQNIIDLSKEYDKNNIVFNLLSSDKIAQMLFEKMKFEEIQRKIYLTKLKTLLKHEFSSKEYKEIPNISKESELLECFKTFLNQIQRDSSKILQTNTNKANNTNNLHSSLKIRSKIVNNEKMKRNIYQTPMTNQDNFNLYLYNKNPNSHNFNEKNTKEMKNEAFEQDFMRNIRKFSENSEEIEMKPKKNNKNLLENEQILMDKITSHHRNEQILQKVNEFHKKHENKLVNLNEENEEEMMKEVSLEKEMDSERKVSLHNALKRQENSNETVDIMDSERFSKKMKMI